MVREIAFVKASGTNLPNLDQLVPTKMLLLER